MKQRLLLYIKHHPPLFTATGFGLAGLPCLLVWDAGGIIPGILISGAVGGICLAYVTNRRDSTVLAMFGFGSAFLFGGMISGGGLILLAERSLSFLGFYAMYILGFGIAGMLAAAFTRSQLMPVANSSVCFIVGSVVGGAAAGIIAEFAGRKSALAGMMGLLITNVVGGGLAGAVSEPSEPEEGAVTNKGRNEG